MPQGGQAALRLSTMGFTQTCSTRRMFQEQPVPTYLASANNYHPKHHQDPTEENHFEPWGLWQPICELNALIRCRPETSNNIFDFFP